MNGSLSAARLLDDVVLLNRAVYGGADDLLPAFLNDYDPARDPDAVGLRTALNVYDRYDLYLDPLGFTTLSSADLGFDPAAVDASETNAGRDLNFTYAGDLYRNNFQQMDDGSLVAYEGAGAVALAAIKDTGASKTLHLVFRGTDADGPPTGTPPDGAAGEGAGQVRYYRQLKPLIDQALAFASDPANGVTDVVVSGHSLGGLMADMFALYDGAAFAALPGVSLQVIALASAGVDPKTLTLMPGYDPSLVNAGPDGVTFNTPPWYAQYDHSEDIVRNPERYDGARHAQTDPEQAPVTQAAVSTLVEHIHFEGSRFEFDAPLIDQYEISANRQTNFLAEHYSSFYELVGTGFSEAAAQATRLDYDRFVTLNGTNERLVGTAGDNNVNGWAVPIDDTVTYAAATDDLFVIGLNGDDRITTGSGSDLLDGGEGSDTLVGGAGQDRLIGGKGIDRLVGGDGVDEATYGGSDVGVTVFLNARSGEGGDAEGDTLVGIASASTRTARTGSTCAPSASRTASRTCWSRRAARARWFVWMRTGTAARRARPR